MNPDDEEESVPVQLTPEQEKTKIFSVPEQNIERLRIAIAKLTKKATKLGTPPITLTNIGVDDKADKFGNVTRHYLVRIEGDAPKLAGWSFIGIAEPSPSGNLLRAVPGEAIPETFRHTGTHCDHCLENRYRNETYIVKNDKGDHKQVGSSCLKDFLGHKDPSAIVKWFRYLHLALSTAAESTMGGGIIKYNLELYLAFVSDIINKLGWMSVTKANGIIEEGGDAIATAKVAYSYMMAYMMGDISAQPPSATAVAHAKNVIEWAKTVLPTRPIDRGFENYTNNLIVIAKDGVVSHKFLNTAASMVANYNRWEWESSKGGFSVGEGTYVLKVSYEKAGENKYGKFIFYVLEDKAHNRVKWFSRGETLEKGKWYKIKGNVYMSSYQGRTEPELKYVTVLGEEGIPNLEIIALGTEQNPLRLGPKGIKIFCAKCGGVTKRFSVVPTETGTAYYCKRCRRS